ncbi:WW domain-containing transcription regulator protein 1 [Acromyrmex echinatior]|uniref:WW domain-containing transcription regulator protein 1 n=1 Tax=Acromyrmex echinatior TaxID=103372 RepID=F4X6Q6_ACREC|nr:WW domain-containing transcription regulator protein 1 [Acromyrmex echinatior]
MALNQDVDQLSKSNPVVRVDQNSESDLQALFDTVLKPDSKRPLQVPLRLRNSPASLQQTYASAQQAPQHAPQPHARHHHHQKQRSYDVISTVDDLGPLPHGWEQARTPEGQIYFLK